MPALSQSLTFSIHNNTSSVQVVYPNTGSGTMVYISDMVKGDGYYGASDGLHTVMYTATPNFVGTVTMQASLATNPIETDWFNVNDVATSYSVMDIRNTSTVDCYNFTGNFVWIRGYVSFSAGTVQSILYNH